LKQAVTFLHGVFFDPEDGGDLLLRSIGWSSAEPFLTTTASCSNPPLLQLLCRSESEQGDRKQTLCCITYDKWEPFHKTTDFLDVMHRSASYL
jgi:hypothetical protein